MNKMINLEINIEVYQMSGNGLAGNGNGFSGNGFEPVSSQEFENLLKDFS